MPESARTATPDQAVRISSRVRRIAAVLVLCCVVLPTTGFWANGNDMGRGISAIRMPIDFYAVKESPVTASTQSIITQTGPERKKFPLSLDRSRYRATLRNTPKTDPVNALPDDSMPESLLSLYRDQVTLALNDATFLPLQRISAVRPSQEYRYWTELGTFLPADGQQRTSHPVETRWLTDRNYKLGDECEPNAEKNLMADMQRLLTQVKAPFSLQGAHPKSNQYMEHIRHAAKRFGLSPRLIYGIMRTESAFNPFAVSNAGALGLMQVVPDTAGNEVQTYLTGKNGVPTTRELFDPKNNIEYGTAYLHLLATRYFASVNNPTSRELCMIAGYNAGPRAVFRAFNTTNQQTAINAINELSPDELFIRLSRHMPAEETRQYIGKVVANCNTFPG